MTDRELLELAAKAAGINFDPELTCVHGVGWEGEDDDGWFQEFWNPITDDGDALRLAVKLKLDVLLFNGGENTVCESNNILDDIVASECWGNDPYAATRRAITRAAAEIGKGMK